MTDTAVITFIVVSKDGNNEEYRTRFTYGNPALVDGTEANYEKIDQCGRAIINLSSNTYVDTLIERTSTISVSEELG